MPSGPATITGLSKKATSEDMAQSQSQGRTGGFPTFRSASSQDSPFATGSKLGLDSSNTPFILGGTVIEPSPGLQTAQPQTQNMLSQSLRGRPVKADSRPPPPPDAYFHSHPRQPRYHPFSPWIPRHPTGRQFPAADFDQASNSSDRLSHSSGKKALNVDSPAFTPSTQQQTAKKSTFSSQAASAAPFTPRGASGKSNQNQYETAMCC